MGEEADQVSGGPHFQGRSEYLLPGDLALVLRARCPLADLSAVPDVPGTYALWDGQRCIYVGMAGRERRHWEKWSTGHPPRDTGTGMRSRLRSHASGRLSGDQFCVYVANRIVLPELLRDPDLTAMAANFENGSLRLDELVRREVLHLGVGWQEVAHQDLNTAESAARRALQPFLNPLPAEAPRVS